MSYQEDVAKAVADPEWQKFRLSLKGLETKEKLHRLLDYFNESTKEVGVKVAMGQYSNEEMDQDLTDIRVRVDNYLKALARGGQIAMTPHYVDDLVNGKLKVLK